MESRPNISNELRQDMETLSAKPIFNPAYRKKKLILWLIRTAATVFLYVMFWNSAWVRWSLVVVVPISLFGLFMIVAFPYIMKRKMQKVRQKIDILDQSEAQ